MMLGPGPNIARRTAAAATLCLLALPVTRASSQAPPGPRRAQRLVVRPAFYFSNTDETTTIGGASPGVIQMGDSALAVNWTGQFELQTRSFGLLGDVSSSTTSNTADFQPSGARTAYDFQILTADLAVGYRLGQPQDRAEMLLLIGGRYFRTEQHLTDSVTSQALGSFAVAWVQPLVGARGKVRLADPVDGWVRFDVGARPVKTGHAAFAWLLHVGLDYWVLGPVGLALQYRYLQLDTGRPGTRDVAFDGPSQGWVLGLNLRI